MSTPSQTTIVTNNASVYLALPVFRFMRPACEIYKEEELLAFMDGYTWRRAGEIVAGDICYYVDGSRMVRSQGDEVASYMITERFLRFTRVKLSDTASGREFELRQRKMWCGTLILSESDRTTAELVQRMFQSKYRITAQNTTPQSILLLSVWLAAVAGVFYA